MPTRRERLERKLEKREEWADSRAAKARRSSDAAHDAVAGIPPGQPILVGHHSERRHRAALKRHDNAMRRTIENEDMAEHHRSKADGLARQLESNIYSDDPDAIERLEERIAELEEEREHRKAVGAAWRKAKRPKADDVDGWQKVAELLGTNLAGVARARADCGSEEGFLNRGPVPSYVLTNLGGNIRRLRERLKSVKARQERSAAAEASPEGVTIKRHAGANWCTVTFAEKPERETLQALKAAGYRWSDGSWHGRLADLPDDVDQLDPAKP